LKIADTGSSMALMALDALPVARNLGMLGAANVPGASPGGSMFRACSVPGNGFKFLLVLDRNSSKYSGRMRDQFRVSRRAALMPAGLSRAEVPCTILILSLARSSAIF
jgi:hypothetical protein